MTMASYGEQDTGSFLQQFTNSVSRALHKQTCTCKGRAYTADELRLKSHPAIFAPNVPEVCFRRAGTDPLLPPLVPVGGDGRVRGAAVGLKGYTRPRVRSEYEFEPPRRRGHPQTKLKALGTASPTKRPRRELSLPDTLDVVDKSGQNWQIVQNCPGKQHKRKTSERPRPLDSSNDRTPPSSFRDGGHKGGILPRPAQDGIPNQPQSDCRKDTDPEGPVLEIEEAPKVAHYQTPSRKVLEFSEAQLPKPPSVSRHMPGETNHRPTPMPDIRKGSIAYRDYPGMLASLTRDGSVHREASQHSKETQATGSDWTLPSLNPATRPTNPTLPVELESLYRRSGLKISTLRIDSQGALPGDFLSRNKEELRRMYPMYDWRVANGAWELGGQKGRNPPAMGPKEIPTAPSMLQLPSTFSRAQHNINSPRDNLGFIGKKRNKMAVRNETSKASRPLETVKEELDKTRDAGVDLEQLRAVQRLGDIRPSSGLFPRQPPPTPMEGRRERVADTQS